MTPSISTSQRGDGESTLASSTGRGWRRFRPDAVDVLALFVVVLAAGAAWWNLGRIGWRPQVVYVAEGGTNWNVGTTPASAVGTIAYAARIVARSGEICILPGTYNERVHVRRGGTSDAPLVIRAQIPGTATVTWSMPLSAPGWHSEGDGIWSTRVTHPVYCLIEGEELLLRLRWGGVAGLRSLVQREGAWGAYWYESDRLYVYLKGGRNPDHVLLRSNRPAPIPREWGELKSANVWVESDHVVIRGLSLEFGIGAGVRVWSGDDVVVEDCRIRGATHGVNARRGMRECHELTVSHCLYDNYPQFEWNRDWLSWNEIYGAYPNNGLVSSNSRSAKLTGNLVVHAGDGMQVTSAADSPEFQVEIRGNRIARITDDAIEFDGDGCNIFVRDNFVSDAHVFLGTSPVLRGPLVAEGNLSWNCVGHVKLLNPWPDRGPIRNVHVRKNVFLNGVAAFWSDEVQVESCEASQNILATQEFRHPVWAPGVDTGSNIAIPVLESAERCVDEVLHQVMKTDEAKHSGFDFLPLQGLLGARYGPSWWICSSHPATRGLSCPTTSSRSASADD